MDSGEPESGWLIFAGSILIIGAIMRFFDALWAFRYHGALPDNLENAIFGRSLATYGWIYIIVAVILFMSGVAVMVRSQIARWVGIVAGGVVAVSAIWWMPYYPVWSAMYVAIGVLVIYALVAHGGRATLDQPT
jgi:hypothetical protein